jgi:hypothetical protein
MVNYSRDAPCKYLAKSIAWEIQLYAFGESNPKCLAALIGIEIQLKLRVSDGSPVPASEGEPAGDGERELDDTAPLFAVSSLHLGSILHWL